jgi:hypothetical protein
VDVLIGWRMAVQALRPRGVDYSAAVSIPRWHRVIIP